MSQYSDFFEDYRKQVDNSNSGYSNSINFIGVSKQDPRIYIELLQPALYPIPYHRWHQVFDGGKKRDFVCRKMMKKDCFICDHFKEAPKPRFIAQVLQLEKDGKVVSPIIEDIKTSSEKADAIVKEFPDIKFTREDKTTTLKDLYRVGFLNVGKSVDDEVSALIEEFDDVEGMPLVLTRKGEGLDTSYNVIPYREASVNKDKLKASVMASSVIDDYINIFASDSRYNKAFNLGKSSGEEADSSQSKEDDESKASKVEDRGDIESTISKLWES